MLSNGVKTILENTGEEKKFTMYLNDIKEALMKVNDIYYSHRAGNTDESGFTSEFYHQLRCIQDDKIKLDTDSPYNGVCFGYDQEKKEKAYLSLIEHLVNKECLRKDIIETNKKILENHNSLEKVIRPDLILHTPYNLDRQEFYGEIKIQGNPKIFEDFIKITEWAAILEEAYKSDTYLINNLDPRFGLYIFIYVYFKPGNPLSVEKSLKEILSRIRKKEKRAKAKEFNRDIICISLINNEKNSVEMRTLGEILDEIKWYKESSNA